MKREFIGMEPREAAIKVLVDWMGQWFATPPVYDAVKLADEILEALFSTKRVIREEDVVDDHTASLIDQLMVQNKTLEKSATLYAQQMAMVDFIRLDRDRWKHEADELRQRIENERS